MARFVPYEEDYRPVSKEPASCAQLQCSRTLQQASLTVVVLDPAWSLQSQELQQAIRRDVRTHKVLAVEGTEWEHFELLEVARGPIIHEHQAKDVLLSLVHRYAFAPRIARPNQHCLH